MRSVAEQAKNLYIARMDVTRSVDTGRAKSSFRVAQVADGAVVSNEAPYFPVLDGGRRPNRPGPPLEPILQWVLRKRLVLDKKGKGHTRAAVRKSPDLMAQARSLAFVIRRAIQRRGQPARHITTEPNLTASIQALIAKMAADVAGGGHP